MKYFISRASGDNEDIRFGQKNNLQYLNLKILISKKGSLQNGACMTLYMR